MSDWTGSLALDLPPRPPPYKKGDRILVRTPDRDIVMIVDEVFQPDEDGVRRATMHQEDADAQENLALFKHEPVYNTKSPAQPSEDA